MNRGIKSPKKLFMSKPAIIVETPRKIPRNDQSRIVGLNFLNFTYPNTESRRIAKPYPASPSIILKNKIKKIPMNIVGFNSLYFGVEKRSTNVLKSDPQRGVSM